MRQVCLLISREGESSRMPKSQYYGRFWQHARIFKVKPLFTVTTKAVLSCSDVINDGFDVQGAASTFCPLPADPASGSRLSAVMDLCRGSSTKRLPQLPCAPALPKHCMCTPRQESIPRQQDRESQQCSHAHVFSSLNDINCAVNEIIFNQQLTDLAVVPHSLFKIVLSTCPADLSSCVNSETTSMPGPGNIAYICTNVNDSSQASSSHNLSNRSCIRQLRHTIQDA